MLPPFTGLQLRILLLALDNLQGEIASDLNGWAIGQSKENDIDPLCDNILIDVEIDGLRAALRQEIH